MTMSEFFFMGGYGFYVWASFGMTTLLIALEVIYVKYQRRSTLRRLQRMARMNIGESNET
jgi:heme exporter protein D